jgi:hypothetical protein
VLRVKQKLVVLRRAEIAFSKPDSAEALGACFDTLLQLVSKRCLGVPEAFFVLLYACSALIVGVVIVDNDAIVIFELIVHVKSRSHFEDHRVTKRVCAFLFDALRLSHGPIEIFFGSFMRRHIEGCALSIDLQQSARLAHLRE